MSAKASNSTDGGSESVVLPSGNQLIAAILGGELLSSAPYDRQVVELVRAHLGGSQVHSRAGQNLAAALEQLAIERANAEGRP